MTCPLCGYQMTPLDRECPRCRGKGVPGRASASPVPVSSGAARSSNAPVVAPSGAPSQTVHAFRETRAKRQTQFVACWAFTALLAATALWFLLQQSPIFALAFLIFAYFPPVFFWTSLDIAHSGQIADTLKAATGSSVYVGTNGQGLSVDPQARTIVVSKEQKDGFLVRRLAAEQLTVQLQYTSNSEIVGRNFSGTGCVAAGCLLGPLGGILGGMALGTPKIKKDHSYRLRILTKDINYPEHTVDFGDDRDRAERFEAKVKALLLRKNL